MTAKQHMTDIKNLLNKLDSKSTPNYAIELRNLLYRLKDSMNADLLINQLQLILDNPNEDINVRFNAYYMLSIFYRRGEHLTKFMNLVDSHSYLFNQYPYTYVTLALKKKYTYKKTGESAMLYGAINDANTAVELLPNDPGVCITYAELIIQSLDDSLTISDSQKQQAFDLILKAMERNREYPKYYSMLGRLYFYEGKFNESCKLIEKAIDLETVSDKDSLLRTSQYYFYLLENKSKEMVRQLDDKLKQNENKSHLIFASLDNIKSKYLELLAFFASILAFIISSINIVVNSNSFTQASALLLVMGGVLSITFVLFRLLIDYNNNPISYKRSGIVVFIAIILIVCGYFMGR